MYAGQATYKNSYTPAFCTWRNENKTFSFGNLACLAVALLLRARRAGGAPRVEVATEVSSQMYHNISDRISVSRYNAQDDSPIGSTHFCMGWVYLMTGRRARGLLIASALATWRGLRTTSRHPTWGRKQSTCHRYPRA